NSDNKNWNGQFLNTGEACPSGTYYYIFEFGLSKDDGKKQTIQGVIHLIR
ncbi:MAG: gliding motility-associated C-terminal domain-containing protein, partial [Bacteroidetes bacterium]|nr:gliding motility-associated C-terminal domain-containing protein [Bacteroidota bacterium]